MTQIESALCGLYIIGILAVLFAVPAAAQESEDLNFASGLEQFQNTRGILPSYLNNIGLQMLTQRQRQIERLVTIEDVSRRRAYLRNGCSTISVHLPPVSRGAKWGANTPE